MKIQNLFLFLLLALSFTIVSCGGDDDVEDGCVLCTLEIPLLADCDVTVCEDGSTTSEGGDVACVSAEAILLGTGNTQDGIVTELEALGFNCNN